MLKKFLGIVFILLMVAVIQLPNAQAQSYPENYNGDPNYPLVYGHMGVAYYLDKSSATVLQDNSDGSKFAVNIITVNESGDISNTQTFWYFRSNNESPSTAYSSSDGQRWRQFNVGETAGFMQVTVGGYKAGYYAAFGHGWF